MAKEKERIYAATDLALKNIVKNSFDDIFVSGKTKHWGDLIEFKLIKHQKLQNELLKQVRNDLIAALNDQKSKRPSCLNNYQKYQNPKRSGLYAYRQAALLEPKTTLAFLSLAILFAQKIEQKRIPVEENTIFSYRFKPNEVTGQIFSESENLGFKGFRKEEFRQSTNQKNNFVLSADISHFYDTLNLHVLENELRDAADEDRFLAERVTRWLDRFLQQTDDGWSKGIPVGNNASRILAEASLIGLDRRLKRTGMNFIRFVDDFKIFTANPIEAQKALEILNQELSKLGLALNDSKVSLDQISDDSREKGQKLLSGQEINTDQNDYLDRTPMTFRKTNKKSKGYEELVAKYTDAYSKYEVGGTFTEQNEVKYLIRYILESENLKTQKKIVGIFERYLSFSKFICSYCEREDTDFNLKEYIFEWFKDNIKNLPNHSIHALFTMVSKEKSLKERAVQEILMNNEIVHQLDSFIFREALITLRTKLSKDDLEDLNKNLIKYDGWTKRAIAYCLWRGNQFNKKEKQIRLIRIAENHNDVFLTFLSTVNHADFKSIVEAEK